MDYAKDVETILQETDKISSTLARIDHTLKQFEERLGDFHANPITRKTHLYEYVNARVNDPNGFTDGTSERRITQFEEILKLYFPGQGFLYPTKLPTYFLIDKPVQHKDKKGKKGDYEKLLVKAGDATELFEHYFSFLLSTKILEKTIARKANSEKVPILLLNGDEQKKNLDAGNIENRELLSETSKETFSLTYCVPRQFIPLFCASMSSLFDNKGGGKKGNGPVYNVADSFLCQSKAIISSVSFQNRLKEVKLGDPACAELFFCWNALTFYKSYRISSVLFKEQLGIIDRIPPENYATNFCYSLEKYLRRELPESANGCITVLNGRLKPLFCLLYGTLQFDLCLLLLADYLKYVLGTCPPEMAAEQHKALCAERFRDSIEFFVIRVLGALIENMRARHTETSSASMPFDKLLIDLRDAEQLIFQSVLYDPKRLPLLQMFDYYKTNKLKIPKKI